VAEDDDDFVEVNFVAKERHRCVTCNKDLSHLDAVRRNLHVNKCLDNEEVKCKVDQIRDNYDKARDCPLCFEPLTPGPHRVTHYKRCARSHNVTAAEMNEMISHVDKVVQIRKRCGIKHTRARKQSNVEIESTLQTKLNKKNKIGPKSLVDEHMQTALALSLSENFVPTELEYSSNKKSALKQATLPTILESTNSEMRLNVMQDRLFEVVLSNSSSANSSMKRTLEDVGDEVHWKSTRWWRIQASENVELNEYRIETFRNQLSTQSEGERNVTKDESCDQQNDAMVDDKTAISLCESYTL